MYTVLYRERERERERKIYLQKNNYCDLSYDGLM